MRSDRPAEARGFAELLGFELAMVLGWVVTVASPTTRSAPRSELAGSVAAQAVAQRVVGGAALAGGREEGGVPLAVADRPPLVEVDALDRAEEILGFVIAPGGEQACGMGRRGTG